MPPTPQTVQLTGQKQSQQQYDPSKGPPVQNAASLHTPPPQLPGRLQPANVPMTSLPAALQPQIVESPAQPQIQVKIQPQSVPLTSAPLPAPLQQQVPPAIHVQGQTPNQVSQPQPTIQQQVCGLYWDENMFVSMPSKIKEHYILENI